MRLSHQRGQAMLEYILLTAMIAMTVAVIIRNTNLTIYRFWTGLARQVASPCSTNCTTRTAPDF